MTSLFDIEDMPITAIAPWFGGKRRLASRIVGELGSHTAYWEIFAGSMATLLSKPPCTMETVNDLHGDMVNLARVIQHPTLGPELYRRMRRWWNCLALLKEAAEKSNAYGRSPAPATPDIDRAEVYFATSWMGRSGVAGTTSYNQGTSRRFTKNGGHAAKRLESATASIPAWRRRMRRVSILSDNGIELAERIEDAKGVVIYADPPYIEKGAKYVHDFTEADHERLAAALRRFTMTRCVVSYYDHPKVRELYAGWTFVDCAMTKSLVSAGKRDANNSVVAPEVLIVNGPSLTGGAA